MIDYLEAVVPLTMVEELLDIHTISGCEKLFDYIERRKPRLIVASIWEPRRMIELCQPIFIFSRIWCLVVAKVLLCYECAMRCFEDYPRRKTLFFVDVFSCSLPIHFLCMNVLVCVSALHPIRIIYSYLDLIRCQSSW